MTWPQIFQSRARVQQSGVLPRIALVQQKVQLIFSSREWAKVQNLLIDLALSWPAAHLLSQYQYHVDSESHSVLRSL